MLLSLFKSKSRQVSSTRESRHAMDEPQRCAKLALVAQCALLGRFGGVLAGLGLICLFLVGLNV